MNRPAFTLGLTIALFLGIGIWSIARSGLGSAEPANIVSERFTKVPLTIGLWVGEDQPANEKGMKVAGAEAYLSRSYRNTKTNDTINVMVLYGNPADLGAHDPKVCYGGTGFEMLGARSQRKKDATGDEFWEARFERTGPNPGLIEVIWAWGLEGRWIAPETARIAFANERRIYKIYLQQSLRDLTSKTSPMDEFLPLFLGDLKTAINAPRN